MPRNASGEAKRARQVHSGNGGKPIHLFHWYEDGGAPDFPRRPTGQRLADRLVVLPSDLVGLLRRVRRSGTNSDACAPRPPRTARKPGADATGPRWEVCCSLRSGELRGW
ncbi:predicted protein [Streptomyces viridochromogenes DSM 40736]|uniref:Predicted protein n=1 Tax=Streptomyces viridochromogenes (strain DSM 40736 / JCM 4977 / BCRC 1201 / Tue 494) TaxID=591159 RepID=D9XBD2_STRVT|nr:predicted protein [Streptomyces viridochromogenes DSM 40736]